MNPTRHFLDPQPKPKPFGGTRAFEDRPDRSKNEVCDWKEVQGTQAGESPERLNKDVQRDLRKRWWQAPLFSPCLPPSEISASRQKY